MYIMTISPVNESCSGADYREVLTGTIHHVVQGIGDAHLQKTYSPFIKRHGLFGKVQSF